MSAPVTSPSAPPLDGGPAGPAGPEGIGEVEPPGLQARFESTPLGRCVITWFLGLVLLTVVASNLPGSSLRRDVETVAKPVEDTFALGQNWALFAPNPSRLSNELVVVVTDGRGRDHRWDPPSQGADGITAYRAYHWRKLEESLIRNPDRGRLVVMARWVAGQQPGGVSRVRITRVARDPLLPGARPRVAHLLDLSFSPDGAPTTGAGS